jgi:toxin-antitoxin system PIN domain toxin
MILPDIGILVYAHRGDASGHHVVRERFESVAGDPAPFALSGWVTTGFVRVVTHPRIFDPPSQLDEALAFVDAILKRPNCVAAEPRAGFWSVFRDMARHVFARGALVHNAAFAALAVQHGATFATTDADFTRFPRLEVLDPTA